MLEAAGEYDEVWHLGDVVGYGASPNQAIEIIERIASVHVRGNHDRVCSGAASSLGFNPVARAAALWTHGQLTPGHITWLRAMPQGPVSPQPVAPQVAAGKEATAANREAAASALGANILCVHGSPLDEDQYILTARDAWAPLQQMAAGVTFYGHTHVQGGFSKNGSRWQEIRPRFRAGKGPVSWTMPMPAGSRQLVNPGSVGQPRDADWRAAFAIYTGAGEKDAAEITYHRVPYDLALSQGKILMAGLPERLAERLREGR